MDDTQTMHAMGIDDAYHVEQVLARGPRGVTELVTIDGVGPFVRKKIPTVLAQRGVWSALGGSTCPRLPRVEATYELPDCVAVVLDYVPGPTLEQVVAERGRLQQNEAVNLAQQICEAVQELHRLGILHRDLTPANIIVADDGAHIIDLGIARPLTDTANRNRDTTALGTYGFASPEQYGFAPTDVRSDIYSLGRILGFMLTGVYPDDTRYTPLLSDDLYVTPRLRAIVERATAFEPSARYQNVAQFAQALTSPTDPVDSYVSAYAIQRPAPNGNPRRRTVITVAAAVIAVVAIVAAAVLISRWIADALGWRRSERNVAARRIPARPVNGRRWRRRGSRHRPVRAESRGRRCRTWQCGIRQPARTGGNRLVGGRIRLRPLRVRPEEHQRQRVHTTSVR